MDVSARYPLDYDESQKKRMEKLSKDAAVCFDPPDGSFLSDVETSSMVNNASRDKYAKIALEFYERSQDAEFEMVEALYSDQSLLVVPGASAEDSTLPKTINRQEWCHISFIAKSKNTDCNDASPKYFFAELLKVDGSTTFNVKYCSTFEPTNDPEFKHGCVFCPADQKFHPGMDGYHIGGPGCSVVRKPII